MNNMSQEQFEKLDDYQRYCLQYQNLLDCDDGTPQSAQLIEYWLNHLSHDRYGAQAETYYQQMMCDYYDHTPEDFMD